MKIAMIDDDGKVVNELHAVQKLNFDKPADRKRILLFVLDALVVDQVSHWFDKDREREDPND